MSSRPLKEVIIEIITVLIGVVSGFLTIPALFFPKGMHGIEDFLLGCFIGILNPVTFLVVLLLAMFAKGTTRMHFRDARKFIFLLWGAHIITFTLIVLDSKLNLGIFFE